jgi:methylphosphotriester-DNA--protein-cysteine methyltransferase
MLLNHRPPAPLDAFVESIWVAERAALPHTRERSLPTGRADIVIPLLQESVVRYDSVDAMEATHFRGGIVQGPRDRFMVRGMGGASSVIGVHFKPAGAVAFFGGALPALRNRTELLEDVWGPSARTLREQLQSTASPAGRVRVMQAHLMQRLRESTLGDAMVGQALRSLHDDPSAAAIEPIQHASGCSPARFIRRFESVVGLTPKRYARVLRFNALLPTLVRCGPRDWATVAADGGYFDQSHLIHEFKRLAGLTPTTYAPLSADQPTHVPV